MNSHQTLDVDAIREWIKTSLTQRDLVRPDGRMLFAYDLSQAEFQILEELIKDSCRSAGGFIHLVSLPNVFSPLFVLYAAEWWKHNYAGGVWDWSPIVESLGGDEESFPQQLRSECVTRGLRFWGHKPLSHGKRFIGAIAAHGGIPMKLLAQGAGRLAIVLEQVLRQAGRYNWSLQQIEECVEQYQHQLPAAYRRPEISDLLARFVDTVLQLKSEYRLDERIDPIRYLDAEVLGWRRRFPVSLEVDAAQSLLVGLVREAASQKPNSVTDLFRCERRLRDGPTEGVFSIEAFLTHSSRTDADRLAQHFGLKSADALPRYVAIELEAEIRQNFIEGRVVLGASEPVVSLSGRRISSKGLAALFEHRLSLRDHSYDIGERVTMAGGGAMSQEDPWVFVPGEDGITRFIAAGSARVQTQSAVIALPVDWHATCDGDESVKPLGVLQLGEFQREIVQIFGDARVSCGDLGYRVRVAQSSTSLDLYQWAGTRLPEASGRQVFRDKVPPRLYRADEEALVKVPLTDQGWSRSGSSVLVNPKDAIGPIQVSIRSDGEVVGRQKIFVLPASAAIQYISGSSVGVGTIRFLNWGSIDVSVQADGQVSCQQTYAPGSHDVTIDLSTTEEPPPDVRAYVKWPGSQAELVLRLPYPVTGGRFIRGDAGVIPDGGKISIRDLIGLRLQVFDTNPTHPKAYALQITMGSGSREISYRYPIALDSSGRANVRLIDYQKIVESLLGLSDELDATVRVVLIVGNVRSSEVCIARFTCFLESETHCVKLPDTIFAPMGVGALTGARILASPLASLAQQPVELAPLTSEGVFTGAWSTQTLDSNLDPWLIYPSGDSTLDFRPRIWTGVSSREGDSPIQGQNTAGCALAQVLSRADPGERWSGLHEVFDAMCLDHAHPSWELLHGLWRTFSHLPLSALDVWKMLGKHSKSLLAFILLSPMPDHELARSIRRFRDETGWAPELNTLDDWHSVIASFWNYWTKQLSPDTAKIVFSTQLDSRLLLLKNEFHSLELMLDFLTFEVTNEPPSSLMAMGAQTPAKVDLLLKDLWVGGESLANVQLFTVNAMRENWPSRGFFEDAFAAFIESLGEEKKRLLAPIFSRLFWIQPGDFKLSVANMPILCALWAATSTSRSWWGEPKNRLNLRRIRDFDPIWFEQGFRHAFAVLLSIQGLVKPKCVVELPN